MLKPEFTKGINLLGNYGLTYDLLIFPRHLSRAVELVKQFPSQVFILDHIAKPDIKNQDTKEWKKGIVLLAEQQNVYCKLSGMVTEANWNKWQPGNFKFYLDAVFEYFGEDRLMTGSDWPVCLLAGEYTKVLEVVMNYLEQYPQTTRNKIMGENAVNIYLRKTT